MVFDLLIIGSVAGYMIHRMHRSFSESISELVWVSLSILVALFMAQPVSHTLHFQNLFGAGIGGLIGFVVISATFLVLRHFFIAVHHREAEKQVAAEYSAQEASDDGDGEEPQLPLEAQQLQPASRAVDSFAFFPALASAILTVGFGISVVWAIPDHVLPGQGQTLQSSAISRLLIQAATPVQPAVDVLVVDAWNDIDRLVSGGKKDFAATAATVAVEAEWELIALANKLRVERGMNPLELDTNLRRAARAQSREMVRLGYFDHQSPERGSLKVRLSAAGIKYDIASENLGNALSTEQVIDEFMRSAHHRENILNPNFRKTGVGAIHAGAGSTMFTQIFSN